MENCWLRCDCCRKWRLVEPDALASLTGMKYKDVAQCADDVDWKGWLAAARERYDEFFHEHCKRRGLDIAGGEACEQGQQSTAMVVDAEGAAQNAAPDLWAEQTCVPCPDESGVGHESGDEGARSSGSDQISDPEEENE